MKPNGKTRASQLVAVTSDVVHVTFPGPADYILGDEEFPAEAARYFARDLAAEFAKVRRQALKSAARAIEAEAARHNSTGDSKDAFYANGLFKAAKNLREMAKPKRRKA